MDATLEQWQQVPQLVGDFYKEAAPLAAKVRAICRKLSCNYAYGQVLWHPLTKEATALLGPDDAGSFLAWQQAFAAAGIPATVLCGTLPDDWQDRILIKNAGWTDYLSPPRLVNSAFQLGGRALGGPHPLSTMLVGGLLTGGLGYGAGALLEHLFPERYVERGKLRKTLGLLGAGLGTAPGWLKLYANQANTAEAGYPTGFWRGMLTPDRDVPENPLYWERQQAYDRLGNALHAGEQLLPQPTGSRGVSPAQKQAAAAFAKYADYWPADDASPTNLDLRTVPVDAFNRAIWNDVHNYVSSRTNPYGTKSQWGDNSQPLHTPPQLGAATSGIVTGIQQMYGGAPLLSPRHFVRGLAAAGVDLMEANSAGKILGALGGLTPMAQEKLQDMGLWGGLIRGTVGSMLGMR